MLNLKEFENYLKIKSEVTKFIPRKKLITLEEVEHLKKLYNSYKKQHFLECFENVGTSSPSFIIEVACEHESEECEQFFVMKVSKTKFVDYLNDKLTTVCEKCRQKISEINNKIQKEINNECEQKFDDYVNNYINTYLEYNKCWVEKTSRWTKWQSIQFKYYTGWERIAIVIKEMDYYKFLQTPYWKAVSLQAKHKASYRCQLCNSGKKLQTHHRSYDVHGYEHLNMNELIVLCEECHQKHHDIECK